MCKVKKILQVITLCVCLLMACAFVSSNSYQDVQIVEELVALADSCGTLVQGTDADINIIPDKYNTGVKGTLLKAGLGEKIAGIQFVAGNNGTVNALDFPLRNPNVSGVVTFENIDFSDYPVWTYRENSIETPIKVIFNNCKFSKIATGKLDAKISYEFNDCTITSFKGSNATFNRCSFGKSYSDGIVPFRNVIVNDCFISDMASTDEVGQGLHTDGTQIYGYTDVDAENIHYNNCRFEIPAIQTGETSASINACIMLQMEYSNAKNISFTNCIVNGGGYSVYANDKHKGYTFTNVSFENIKSGCAKVYGTLYPFISEGVSIKNISSTKNLYVGSIWKETGKTHISVTNDTNQERILLVYADEKEYEYTIDACPNGDKLYSSYESYPFDVDIEIPMDCDYIVCYDMTDSAEQIRFQNWSGKSVYVDKNILEKYISKNQKTEVLIEGKCGSDVAFSLSSDGTLELIGTGKTDAYNSQKSTPWSEYKSMITSVKVQEGITSLGAQIFKGCSNIRHVSFNEGLESISSRAFDSCYGLEDITLPNSICSIGDYAFWGTVIQNTYYNGTSTEWSSVSVGKNNDMLLRNIIYYEETSDVILVNQVPVVSEGSCGKNVAYRLTADGVLAVFGEGVMENYNSLKTAPWYEMRNKISKIIVDEGVTVIGTQAFRQCKNVEEVLLPDSLKIIGGNAFIQCVGLKNIVLPKNLQEIQRYAFAGTSIQECRYAGNMNMWNAIAIGIKNEVLRINLICN